MEAPQWVVVDQIAQRYSVKPWDVEAEISQLWWDRYRVLMEETPRPKGKQ